MKLQNTHFLLFSISIFFMGKYQSPLQVNPISTVKTYSLVHSKLNNLAQNSTDNMHGTRHTVRYLPDPIQIYWHAMNECCICAICYNPQHLCAMFDTALET